MVDFWHMAPRSIRKKKIKSVLYLYPEQMKALKQQAERLDTPISALIRQAVDEYLRKSTSLK